MAIKLKTLKDLATKKFIGAIDVVPSIVYTEELRNEARWLSDDSLSVYYLDQWIKDHGYHEGCV